jgi:hypothetical protein
LGILLFKKLVFGWGPFDVPDGRIEVVGPSLSTLARREWRHPSRDEGPVYCADLVDDGAKELIICVRELVFELARTRTDAHVKWQTPLNFTANFFTPR